MIDVSIGAYKEIYPNVPDEQLRRYLNNVSITELEQVYAYEKQLLNQAEAAVARVTPELELRIHHQQKHQAKLAQYEDQDRAVFAQACRQNNISGNEANWNAIRKALGPGFDLDQANEFIKSSQFSFSPVTPQELAEWEDQEKQILAGQIVDGLKGQLTMRVLGVQSYIGEMFVQPAPGDSVEQNRARNLKRLAKLPIDMLREMAGVAAHNQQVKQGLTTAAPTTPPSPQLNSGSGLDRANGGAYLPLPATNQNGEPIDAAYLVRISNTDLGLYKRLLVKHGYFHVTNRLKGVA
jgi:hypothetical protein